MSAPRQTIIFKTTLSSDIDAEQRDIPLTDPMEPHTVIVIDDEYIALMEPTMRGICGTDPVPHKAGAEAWVIGVAMSDEPLAPLEGERE